MSLRAHGSHGMNFQPSSQQQQQQQQPQPQPQPKQRPHEAALGVAAAAQSVQQAYSYVGHRRPLPPGAPLFEMCNLERELAFAERAAKVIATPAAMFSHLAGHLQSELLHAGPQLTYSLHTI